LNRRTFFRYFADKREVLFWGSEALEEWVVTAIEAADAHSTPFELVRDGLRAAGAAFQERRPAIVERQHVIDATPELQERERTKLARLVDAIADALRRKGVDPDAAGLAAETGVALLRVAFARWIDPSNRRDLRDHIDDSVTELAALITRPAPQQAK
jgi:AcrR family transcriptional regulator